MRAMNMTDVYPDSTNYRSYLLRLWPSTRQAEITWHAMLEDPRTGERHSFASPAELGRYLEDELSYQKGG
jgi:hypothetical protein